MSETVITYTGSVARWEPDAKGRMVAAALDLFTERGFEATTAADIADRAGVTERTFFRHFADKREVLFDGSSTLAKTAYDAILTAPEDASPLEAGVLGMAAAGGMFDEIRGHAVRRAKVVEANPALRERELLKLAALTETTAEALRARGVAEPEATLAAHSATTVFHVAFTRWVATRKAEPFADHVTEAARALRGLT
jgi:AcrR family transcriptional regulator